MGWTHRKVTYLKTPAANDPPGKAKLYINWVGQADATDLSDYAVLDISVDAPGYTRATVQWARVLCGGVQAAFTWQADTDDFLFASQDGTQFIFPPPWKADDLVNGSFNRDPQSTGYNGDIVVNTTGGAAGDGIVASVILTVE